MELGPWEFLMSVNGRPAFVGPHLDELLNLAEEYVADGARVGRVPLVDGDSDDFYHSPSAWTDLLAPLGRPR